MFLFSPTPHYHPFDVDPSTGGRLRYRYRDGGSSKSRDGDGNTNLRYRKRPPKGRDEKAPELRVRHFDAIAGDVKSRGMAISTASTNPACCCTIHLTPPRTMHPLPLATLIRESVCVCRVDSPGE